MKRSAADKQAAEETMQQLSAQLAEKHTQRSALETDLKIEKEWRATLQRSLETEKERLSKQQTELQQLRDNKRVRLLIPSINIKAAVA